MKPLATAALLLAPILSAFGQDMSPPKEVTALKWLVGTWSGSGKITFGGRESTIATKMTVSFDGYFLKSVSTDTGSGFTMTKTALTGWDAPKGEYVNYTFTNIAPAPRIERGKMDGDKLVLVSDPWEAEGMKLVGRETMSKISSTKCGLILEAMVGGKWQKEMDFVLTKK